VGRVRALAGRRQQEGEACAGSRRARERHQDQQGGRLMSRWALALLLSTTAACSGGANSVGKGPRLFAPDWQNDGGRSITEVQVRVQRSPLPAGTPVAVGFTERGLVGIRLDGCSKWSYPTMLDARPIVTGELVVGSGGGRLFALE